MKKFLINYIKKTYDFGDNIGAALANRELDMDEWMPTVRESDKLDKEKAADENS